MGRVNKYFKVSGLRFLQALTYPERRTAVLISSAHKTQKLEVLHHPIKPKGARP